MLHFFLIYSYLICYNNQQMMSKHIYLNCINLTNFKNFVGRNGIENNSLNFQFESCPTKVLMIKNQLDPKYIHNLKLNLSGDATMTVRIPGFHAMGARKEVTNGKEDACIEACDTNPVCMAADYNQNEESCWVHMKGGEGVCGPLVDSPPVIHYKKYHCGKQLMHHQCSL